MNKYQIALNDLKKVTLNCKLTDLIITTLQELVDKATPKKVVKVLSSCPECPTCGTDNRFLEYGDWSDTVFNYCGNCGQALDWSEEND